jgi:hypothetical protein
MIAMVVDGNAGGDGRNLVAVALHGIDRLAVVGDVERGRAGKLIAAERLPRRGIYGADLWRRVIGDEQPPCRLLVGDGRGHAEQGDDHQQ